MHEVLVNRLGGLSLPRKSVVRLTDRPDMTLDVYRGRKTTKQQCLPKEKHGSVNEKIHDPLFCADRIDVITNFVIITNAVIKRVYCNKKY